MRSWPIYDVHEEGDTRHDPWWARVTLREKLLAVAIITALFLAMWLASALSNWAIGGPA